MVSLVNRNNFYVKVSNNTPLTMPEIFKEVVEKSEISGKLILSPTRVAEVVVWRQIAMYLMCRTGYFSLKEIGRFWGKDHSTIISARDRIQDLLDCNDTFVTTKINLVSTILNSTPSNYKPKYSYKKFRRNEA